MEFIKEWGLPIGSIAVIVAIMVIAIMGVFPEITTGEIYYKEIQPEKVETHLYPVHMSPKQNLIIPHDKVTPERYMICIKAGDKTERFFVSKSVYNTFEIGDIYTYDKTRGDEVN